MNLPVELMYNQLKKIIDPDTLGFETTDDLEPYDGLIAQERASGALDFGLRIKARGCNIFVSGQPGSGRMSYTSKRVREFADSKPVPSDWCYIYNFDNPRAPKVLELDAGDGRELRDDIDELIELMLLEIPKLFVAEEYEREKNEAIKLYQDNRDILIKEISEKAKEYSFTVKYTNSGIYFMPMVDGETLSEDEYDELSDEQREIISGNTDIVQEKAGEIMRCIRELELTAKKKIDDMTYKVALFTIGHHFEQIKEKYKKYSDVIAFVNRIKEDILNNISDFVNEDEDSDDNIQNLIPQLSKKSEEDTTNKYRVNLFVDNKDTKGAPVIIDYNPTYYNLDGEIEYDNEFGNLITDFMKIKPGLLHKANGGYLIVQADDIFSNIQSWDLICRVIKTRQLNIESLREQLGGIAVLTLRPQPILCDVKIIMIGSLEQFEILSEYDPDFKKCFKILVDFDYEMKFDPENVLKLARFVKAFTERENSLVFHNSAIAALLEYSQRLVERQDRMTGRLSQIEDILFEANAWTEMVGEDIVKADNIKKAISEKEKRVNMLEQKMSEMIEDNFIIIETSGAKIGQINGLAVIDTGTHIFAKPSLITATVYVGKAGIVNIEKEADLSGNIHDKGIQALTGFIGETYAQDFPLALSCRVTFEQSYSGVDGDSASSAELYAILSALARLPIRQEIAVTGSINQKGYIQPIGGVSYKIEGFFDLCKSRGLTGTQGVIIPYQNIVDLVLKDEVIEKVRAGEFHIYPISHINEGLEILTGVKAGNTSEENKYDDATIHGKVQARLRGFYISAMENKL